jgi:Na+/H+-translocating membrane pyrophosphatase
MDGIGPLLAVIIGIFLTMIIIAKIIGLYKETNTKETQKIVKATSSERKGRGFWIFDN